MKALKVLAVCALIAVSGQSFAKSTITPINFSVGSYCGSFRGDMSDRVFTLHAKAGQQIIIEVSDVNANVLDVEIKDPRGRILKDVGSDHEWAFNTTKAGKHTITLELEQPKAPNSNFEVCVY